MKIISIVGARPQFIKAAMVSKAINYDVSVGKISLANEFIVHTGQHYDKNMSEVFFRDLELKKPVYNLGIGGGTHSQNTGRMIEKLEEVLLVQKPDWVVIYGDTDSTLAGALAAAKLQIPVAHVEAGLRSFNRRMPEEINRIVADQLSTVLFCPTETAVENLKREGFPNRLTSKVKQQIFKVGDVMYDAALFYGVKAEGKSRILKTVGLESKNYVLATIHRAENSDDASRLGAILDGLNEIAEEVRVILPLHPRTRKKLDSLYSSSLSAIATHLTLIEPIGYIDMVMLEKNSKVIITDSGGVQKEAYFHGVPCITVRDETEWVELVEIGANCLAGANQRRIVKAYHEMKNKVISTRRLYGDGNSAQNILMKLISMGPQA